MRDEMSKMNPQYKYVSEELNYFSEARNYRKYWYSRIKPFIPGGPTVEIGSGIGSNAELLSIFYFPYLGVEPDLNLVLHARKRYPNVDFHHGTSSNCKEIGSATSIFYLDVLEHIENDEQELEFVCSRMKRDAVLVVLVPAHQHLFSSFDRYVGHYRRYSLPALEGILPKRMRLIHIEYLDSVGYMLSLFSNKFLRGKLLNRRSVKMWDSLMPLSRRIDSLINHRLGKSILMVAKKID
jgi:hypothetical protein